MTPCFAYETSRSARREPVGVVDREATHRAVVYSLEIGKRRAYVCVHVRVLWKQLRAEEKTSVPRYDTSTTKLMSRDCRAQGHGGLYVSRTKHSIATVPPTSLHSADRPRYDKFSDVSRWRYREMAFAFKASRLISRAREVPF